MRVSLYERIERDRLEAGRAARDVEQRQSELASVRRELASIEVSLAFLKLERALARKYRQDQPRVPAGQPGGGQWTSGDGGTGRNDPRDTSDSASNAGGQYAQITGERRYSVDLEEERARGGHAVRDHVEKNDAELFKELDNDWKRLDSGRLQITEYRPAEGSFSSLTDANDFVNQTLRANRDKVDAVATGREEDATLEKRFGFVTGYEAYRELPDSESRIRNTYGVRVIIYHDTRSERGYTVRTAFPINYYSQRRKEGYAGSVRGRTAHQGLLSPQRP